MTEINGKQEVIDMNDEDFVDEDIDNVINGNNNCETVVNVDQKLSR